MTTIEELPAELGFVETELLKALHQMVVAAYLANGLKASSLMAGYQQVGEQLIAGIEEIRWRSLKLVSSFSRV